MHDHEETGKSRGAPTCGRHTPPIGHGIWRTGTIVASLILLAFGATMIAMQTVATRKGMYILGGTGLFLTLSAGGLLLRQGWSRTMALCGLPVILLFATPLSVRPATALVHHFALSLIITSTAIFIYLLLPPVARQFGRTTRTQRQGMRITKLSPPPREVPLSIRLSLTWGSNAGKLFTAMMAFISLPMVMQMRESMAGVNIREEPVFILLLLIPLAVMSAFTFAARFVMKASAPDIALLRIGRLSSAKVTKKRELPIADAEVYRVYYEYEVDGTVHKSQIDTDSPARLEDDPLEPVLYSPEHPSQATLLDSLPAHIATDSRGNWVHRFAFMGYVYLAFPILVILAALYLAIR